MNKRFISLKDVLRDLLVEFVKAFAGGFITAILLTRKLFREA